MIIWTKKEGYIYEDESNGKRYALFEMMCYRGKATSDIVTIWDIEKDCFVNHVYGATHLDGDIDELEKTIKGYVDEYTKKKTPVTAHYPLTKAGVKAWGNDVVDDILDRGLTGNYTISHRNRVIELPDLAEIHEAITAFMAEAEEIANE